ncbi:MAG: FeoA domain-containing protein [candidate division WOR-3 bacterium]|nr:FeoA domain-containing protein [candidate division WOR-3 bacterium]MCX7837081.1 FeoA domain-containing protein [candidate division WOR-3 bacterium]MDW8114246.1 FeoA domain-containing protein [candidate division WOR-3 bacterium]
MGIAKNVKKVKNLKELGVNKKVKIKKINLSLPYLKRLSFLGVRKKSKIEKLCEFKDLLIFKIKKGIIILPKNLAKEILIENERSID